MLTARKVSKRLEKRTDVDTHYYVCVCVCLFVCLCVWEDRTESPLAEGVNKHDKFWYTDGPWQIYKLETLQPLRS